MRSLFVVISIALAAYPVYVNASAVREVILNSKSSQAIEYFWSKPEGLGPFPVLLMIHPDQDSPKTGGRSFVDSGQLDFWAKKGFLTVAISQPGYGGSERPSDFCGPKTQQAVIELIRALKSKTDLVSKRIFL
jgi:hypothetical protein